MTQSADLKGWQIERTAMIYHFPPYANLKHWAHHSHFASCFCTTRFPWGFVAASKWTNLPTVQTLYKGEKGLLHTLPFAARTQTPTHMHACMHTCAHMHMCMHACTHAFSQNKHAWVRAHMLAKFGQIVDSCMPVVGEGVNSVSSTVFLHVSQTAIATAVVAGHRQRSGAAEDGRDGQQVGRVHGGHAFCRQGAAGHLLHRGGLQAGGGADQGQPWRNLLLSLHASAQRQAHHLHHLWRRCRPQQSFQGELNPVRVSWILSGWVESFQGELNPVRVSWILSEWVESFEGELNPLRVSWILSGWVESCQGELNPVRVSWISGCKVYRMRLVCVWIEYGYQTKIEKRGSLRVHVCVCERESMWMKNGSVFVQSANRQVIEATACVFMQVCVESSN